MADTGTCIYYFNPHENYVNPDQGWQCGATTYVLDERDKADPYCPAHGGTPETTNPEPTPNPEPEATVSDKTAPLGLSKGL